MKLKLIKNEPDYAAAMARLSALMAADPDAGSAAENELDLLALVIEDYERKIVPPVVPDPIEAILFRLDQAGLTRKDLIPYIGSAPKVSEVLARKRPLSLTMIRRLHQGLGIPADVLIGGAEAGESVLEAPEIDYTRFPLKEMFDRGCFGNFNGNAARLKDYAEDLMREFLRGLSPNPAEPVLMRAPMHQRGARQMDEAALLAWRLCVLKKARAMEIARDYKKGVITARWLRELSRLSSFQEGPKLAREYLARAGIALVIEPHFKATYLDGAAMLDQGRPIVALTLRHDRLDNFWFVLLHELAHVARHLDESHPFFADDLDSPDKTDRQEAEADEMAQEALLPKSEWAAFATKANPTATTAQALADRLGIDPAIVAGRVRHEQQNFRLLSRLLGQGEPSRQLAAEQGNP
ncbi:MAG: ImmA/IrrE family metallo-endopeptidase [Pseudomonadota bacterium]